MKHTLKKVLCLLFTILMLVFIFWKIDVNTFLTTLKTFNFKIILLVVIIFFITILLRGYRWKILLNNNVNFSIWDLSLIFNLGATMNAFLPLRAGDFFRAYYIGKKTFVRKTKIFGTIIFERLLDGMTVVLILMLSIFLYQKTPFLSKIAIISSIIFFVPFLFIFLIFKYNKVDKIMKYIEINMPFLIIKKIVAKFNFYLNQFLNGFDCLNDYNNLLKTFVLSFLIWTLECVIVYLILSSFNFHFSFLGSMFVISLIALSTIIPSTSVFIGPYQIAFIISLSLFGVAKTEALTISVVHQTIVILTMAIISAYLLISKGIKIPNMDYANIKEVKRNGCN